MGKGNGYFVLSKVKSYGNALVVFYQKLPIGRKGTRFVDIYQNILIIWHLLNYEDIFVETPIYGHPWGHPIAFFAMV